MPQIPQLNYDVLARILPGAYGVMAVSLALDTNAGSALAATLGTSKAASESATILLVFLLMAAYITGLALSLIGDSLQKLLTQLAPSYFNMLGEILRDQHHQPASVQNRVMTILKEECTMGMDDVPPGFLEKLIILWYDRLRLQSNDFLSRLTRLRAEYRMYGSLAVASYAAAVLHAAKSLRLGESPDPLLLVVSMAAGLLFTWGMARSYRYFQTSIINHYCGEVAKAREEARL